MDNCSRERRLCELYIRHVSLVGVLYCAIPTVLWFAGVFFFVPFRSSVITSC